MAHIKLVTEVPGPKSREIFSQHTAAEEVAALIMEPVLGESSVVVPPEDCLPALESCK